MFGFSKKTFCFKIQATSLVFAAMAMQNPKGVSQEFGASPANARFALFKLALTQSEHISERWNKDQRDCAGFVRFLYRDAITHNSHMWIDSQGKVQDFVQAAELIQNNFSLVSRNLKEDELQTGDVLAFFSSYRKPQDAWHVMVVLKPMAIDTQKTLLVYHNGEMGAGGQVKKVWLSELLKTSASEWRPVAENSRFMGAYRWKGWQRRMER